MFCLSGFVKLKRESVCRVSFRNTLPPVDKYMTLLDHYLTIFYFSPKDFKH